MSDITIKYKGATIAAMDATGSKTLGTAGKYCEGDIGVEYVKPSGGTVSTSVDAIKAYLESNGFVVSEFAVPTSDSGQYISVPHSLGHIPDLVFAFSKDLQVEPTQEPSAYQLGCASVGNYGIDNNNNRTYQCYGTDIGGSLLYTDCLRNFPIAVRRTQYDFCQSASATDVSLRNGSGGNVHMLGTTWILAVK